MSDKSNGNKSERISFRATKTAKDKLIEIAKPKKLSDLMEKLTDETIEKYDGGKLSAARIDEVAKFPRQVIKKKLQTPVAKILPEGNRVSLKEWGIGEEEK